MTGRNLAAALMGLAGACVPASEPEVASATGGMPMQSAATPTPAPTPLRGEFTIEGGALEQGGWLRGRAPTGAVAVRLDRSDVPLAPDGMFFAGLDRDAPMSLALEAVLADGRKVRTVVSIKPRDWPIERVNVALAGSVPSETFMALRRPELEAIAAARAKVSDSRGWTQAFIWPARGRISGRFGSQRIYRGVPGAYHSGLDIATGGSGAPYVAPADGVVVLAAERPFTLEGNLLIIDHGMGLNSAFLHSSRLMVSEGDRVSQGQVLGHIGATGRASGPHLHWSLKWNEARLDPLLFLPAAPP